MFPVQFAALCVISACCTHRMKAPATPGGKQLQQQELSRLAIPPAEREEEWVQQMAAVHGQLIESLEQLVVRDGQLAEDAMALERFQVAIRGNTDQMAR